MYREKKLLTEKKKVGAIELDFNVALTLWNMIS